eukprot:403371344
MEKSSKKQYLNQKLQIQNNGCFNNFMNSFFIILCVFKLTNQTMDYLFHAVDYSSSQKIIVMGGMSNSQATVAMYTLSDDYKRLSWFFAYQPLNAGMVLSYTESIKISPSLNRIGIAIRGIESSISYYIFALLDINGSTMYTTKIQTTFSSAILNRQIEMSSSNHMFITVQSGSQATIARLNHQLDTVEWQKTIGVATTHLTALIYATDPITSQKLLFFMGRTYSATQNDFLVGGLKSTDGSAVYNKLYSGPYDLSKGLEAFVPQIEIASNYLIGCVSGFRNTNSYVIFGYFAYDLSNDNIAGYGAFFDAAFITKAMLSNRIIGMFEVDIFSYIYSKTDDISFYAGGMPSNYPSPTFYWAIMGSTLASISLFTFPDETAFTADPSDTFDQLLMNSAQGTFSIATSSPTFSLVDEDMDPFDTFIQYNTIDNSALTSVSTGVPIQFLPSYPFGYICRNSNFQVINLGSLIYQSACTDKPLSIVTRMEDLYSTVAEKFTFPEITADSSTYAADISHSITLNWTMPYTQRYGHQHTIALYIKAYNTGTSTYDVVQTIYIDILVWDPCIEDKIIDWSLFTIASRLYTIGSSDFMVIPITDPTYVPTGGYSCTYTMNYTSTLTSPSGIANYPTWLGFDSALRQYNISTYSLANVGNYTTILEVSLYSDYSYLPATAQLTWDLVVTAEPQPNIEDDNYTISYKAGGAETFMKLKQNNLYFYPSIRIKGVYQIQMTITYDNSQAKASTQTFNLIVLNDENYEIVDNQNQTLDLEQNQQILNDYQLIQILQDNKELGLNISQAILNLIDDQDPLYSYLLLPTSNNANDNEYQQLLLKQLLNTTTEDSIQVAREFKYAKIKNISTYMKAKILSVNNRGVVTIKFNQQLRIPSNYKQKFDQILKMMLKSIKKWVKHPRLQCMHFLVQIQSSIFSYLSFITEQILPEKEEDLEDEPMSSNFDLMGYSSMQTVTNLGPILNLNLRYVSLLLSIYLSTFMIRKYYNTDKEYLENFFDPFVELVNPTFKYYAVILILRRLLYCAIIVFLIDFQSLQVTLMVFLSALITIYIAGFKPYQDWKTNIIEVFNELCILSVLMTFIPFSDAYNVSDDTLDYISYYPIAVVAIFMLVNIMYVMYQQIVNSLKKIKARFLKQKAKIYRLPQPQDQNLEKMFKQKSEQDIEIDFSPQIEIFTSDRQEQSNRSQQQDNSGQEIYQQSQKALTQEAFGVAVKNRKSILKPRIFSNNQVPSVQIEQLDQSERNMQFSDFVNKLNNNDSSSFQYPRKQFNFDESEVDSRLAYNFEKGPSDLLQTQRYLNIQQFDSNLTSPSESARIFSIRSKQNKINNNQ